MAMHASIQLKSNTPMADFVEAAVLQRDVLQPNSEFRFNFARTPVGGTLTVETDKSAGFDYHDKGKLQVEVTGNELNLGGCPFYVRGQAATLLRRAFLSPLGSRHGVTGRMEVGHYDSDTMDRYDMTIMEAKSPNAVVLEDWTDNNLVLLQRSEMGSAPSSTEKPFFNKPPFQAWKKVAGGIVVSEGFEARLRAEISSKLEKISL